MSKLKKIELIDDVWMLDGRVVSEELMKSGTVDHQPNKSWTLDENFQWQPPVPYPDDGKGYMWNEDELKWDDESAAAGH
jgi:hypothetical protein